jgi:ABC-type multidrug transport system fused ATPase/permease subunit
LTVTDPDDHRPGMRLHHDLPAALRVLREGLDGAASRIGVILLLIAAAGVAGGLAPLALKGMVDAAGAGTVARGTAFITSVVPFGTLYLLALGGSRLLTELRPPLVGALEQRFYAGLRNRYLRHLLDLPLAFHLGQRSGALVHALQQATTGYQIIIFNLVNNVVPVLVELVTVTLVLVHLGQPELTVTFGATALAYLAVMTLHKFQIGGHAREVSKAALDVQAALTDGLLNVETIKCFGADQTVLRRFASATASLENRWTKLYQQRSRMGLALTATFALSMAASLAIAMRAVADGTLGVGGFVLVNVYMLQVVRPLEMLGAAVRDLSQAIEFIRPLLDVLEQSPEPPTRGERRDRPGLGADSWVRAPSREGIRESRTPSLSFRGLNFSYRDGAPVLRGFNLDIAPGRTIAIVGASGSGKSSLARLLLRLHEPQSGSIQLDDVPIDAVPLAGLRASIGLVPQDIVLFDDTIAFNIGIGRPDAPRHDIEEGSRLARLDAFVRALPAGYDTVVGERGLKLSGGERQRIAIARVFLKRPSMWVLDEATSMLDGLTERAVLHNLHAQSEGRTMIVIAHRLTSVQHADEIVVLSNGRIAEQGCHDELLARGGAYADLWRAQQVHLP